LTDFLIKAVTIFSAGSYPKIFEVAATVATATTTITKN
jgi:hypothetical protein